MDLDAISIEFPFVEYCLTLFKNMPQDFEIDANLDKRRLGKLLNSSLKLPKWLDYSEVAADGVTPPAQLDLLGHSNEPVLLMESGDGASFYLIKFKRYETSEDLFYGRDQKYLIEKCLIIWLSSFVKTEPLAKQDFENYFQICKNQLLKINYLNDELMKQISGSQKFFTSLFNYFLRDEILPGTKISLSDSTLEYLEAFDLDFSELEIIALEAYKVAAALSPSSTDIRIKRYFLPEQSSNKSLKTISSTDDAEIINAVSVLKPVKKPQFKLEHKPGGDKLNKTMQLLDRYEIAVKKLIDDRLPVMGKNIARVCVPSISAPALTDSINKHKDRIIECLKLYPDNWPLLKTNYQPIQKLTYQ